MPGGPSSTVTVTVPSDSTSLVEHMLHHPPHVAANAMREQLEYTYEVLRSFAIGADITIADR